MTDSLFPLLFSPIKIGSLEIRNRIVLTAHGTGMARDLLPSEQMIHYYAERAKGGVGLIMVGSQQIHPTSPGITGLLCNYDESIIPGLKRIMDVVHGNGAKAFAQLNHMGLATTSRPNFLWSASALADQKFGEVAHQMTELEIEELVEAFASAAARSIKAGMDGISIHCAHGLLIHQFLSPYTNKRTDIYGGSMENRMRFPIQVFKRVRERIGPDVPLGMRVSGDELVDGGLTLDDMKEIVPVLVDAGNADFVDVSAGNDGHHLSNMLHEPPMGIPTAHLVYVAAGIKEVVQVPVIHATRINDPVLAEKILNDGLTDMIGMCRALIADPHLPNKAKKGQLEDIKPCIACNHACFGRLDSGKHISCVGNPITGREEIWATMELASVRKKVMVVGGGLAGMEAAIIAQKRGHKVSLLEKNQELGGQILLAAKAPARDEIVDMVRYRVTQMEKLGIDVRLGIEATPDLILNENPDALVIATGAVPRKPDLPASDRTNVVTGEAVLEGTVEVGDRVVVVDNDNYGRGLYIADFLSEREIDVEIITEGAYVGYRMVKQNYIFECLRLYDKQVKLTPHTTVSSIEDDCLIVHNPFTMAERVIEGVDTVVMIAPGKANENLMKELRGRIGEIHLAGDCVSPRDMEAAILEGHKIGRML